MPAAIPFAFPDAMMPASPMPADAGGAAAEGAAIFGQLVDAAAMPAGQAAPANAAPAAATLPLTAPFADALGKAATAPTDALSAPALAATVTPEAPEQGDVAELPIAAPKAEVEEEAPAEQEGEAEAAVALLEVPAKSAPAKPAALAGLAEEVFPAPEHPEDSDALPIVDAAPDAPSQDRAAAPIAAPVKQSAAPQAQSATPESAEPADGAPLPTTPAPRTNAERLAEARTAPPSPPSSPAGEAASPQNANEPAPNFAAQAAAATKAPATEGAMPAALLTQSMGPISNSQAATPNPYAATMASIAADPVVEAQPGRMGAAVGAEIAKVARGDGDSVLIRLDPREMGRVDVRLSFDREGMLRAVMTVESPAALDMLRREAGDLTRALVDAGVRSDGQSLRFDARSGDGSGQQGQQGQGARSGGSGGGSSHDGRADHGPDYQPLRTSTQVDLIA